MPEQDRETSEYIKGFNEGYLITQHLPDLADRLATIETDVPRVGGFKDGRKQYALDQVRNNRAKWAAKETPSKAEKSQERDFDRE
ncbi:hypothetical protein [Flavobacterium sp.]|uniref:hypothetical protein n=1 Tax=Flavobacterium sp. TaxID=239 RepID=UPI0039E3C373